MAILKAQYQLTVAGRNAAQVKQYIHSLPITYTTEKCIEIDPITGVFGGIGISIDLTGVTDVVQLEDFVVEADPV